MKTKTLTLLLVLILSFSLSSLVVLAESTPLPDDIGAEEASGGRELDEPFDIHLADPSSVSDEDQLIYYFYKDGCPWCEEISSLLAAIPDEVPTVDGKITNVKIVGLDKNLVAHGELIEQYYENLNLHEERRYVPMLIIGHQNLFLGDEIVPALLPALFNGEGLDTPREYLPQKPELIYLYDEVCASCTGEENWTAAVGGYLNLHIQDHFELRFINRRSERAAADRILDQLPEPVDRYPVVIYNNEVLLSGGQAIEEGLVPMLLDVQRQDALPIVFMDDEPSENLMDELYLRIREDRLKSIIRVIKVESDEGKVILPQLVELVGESPEGVPALLAEGEWIIGVTPILQYLDAQ